MNQAWKLVSGNFAMEDIHAFRIEIKKLRSFLCLASTAPHACSLKVSVRMDRLYTTIGNIRSLQLQKQRMDRISPQYAPIQKSYLTFISTEIERQTVKAGNLAKSGKFLKKSRRMILNQLPSRLKQKSIRMFTNEKLQALSALMKPSSLSDESLHAIRKLLKEISYSWKLTNKRTSILSVIVMSKKELDYITDILGDFHDRCIELDLLHAHYKQQQMDENERRIWREWENDGWFKKERAREGIHALFQKGISRQLQDLRFLPGITRLLEPKAIVIS
ncbi:MAG: hypothetical protein DI538_21690 [Azospira oryzae]|jgi:CHAD domain-containing protein|nr:MAG: hypothetical protein DI538_21690 [Azospira oryzae]